MFWDRILADYDLDPRDLEPYGWLVLLVCLAALASCPCS